MTGLSLNIHTVDRWAWLILVLIALTANILGYISAIGDRKLFTKKWAAEFNGAGKILADAAVRREIIRLVASISLLIFTVTTLSFPAQSDGDYRITVLRWTLSFAFVCLTVQSVWDYYSRKKVLEQLEKRAE